MSKLESELDELTKKAAISKLKEMTPDYIKTACEETGLDFNDITHYKIVKLYGIAMTSLYVLIDRATDEDTVAGVKTTALIIKSVVRELFCKEEAVNDNQR